MRITEADIREAVVASAIHTLRLASYAIESQLIDYPSLPALHETVHDVQALGESFLVCTSDDGVLLGALSFTREAGLTAGLLNICSLTVHPDFFGRGVASQLLQAVEALVDPGTRIIVSTAQKNMPAVRLYQKHGYAIYAQPTLPDGLALVKLERRVGFIRQRIL